jgi:hydroxymethylpyrimidine pyrophosphatase-like HAD family hydrolase
VDWNGVVADMSTRLYYRHERADKWDAVLDTAEFLGIDRKNILTFGDNWNDIQMLTENPNGYALKGSYAERQGIRSTEFTCKEDGVARELVKIFDL